ncbi:MAG: hypothetical protein A2Y58_03690 [Chloroflexi bacterium RBG_13_51_52]|nr:MAG: hypothetical protein A2Y58_03690 [Chloroflexi bacterium RBG_13_51_52]
MIDYSLIKIIPADESHYEFVYRVKKEAYGDYIARVFGWDENKERGFHAKDWEALKPSVILYDNQPVGTFCFTKKGGHFFTGRYFIEHFYILPEHQDKGIGSFVLNTLLDTADNAGLPVNLIYFSFNPAASLYARMGFEVIEIKEPFVIMERKPSLNKKVKNREI